MFQTTTAVPDDDKETTMTRTYRNPYPGSSLHAEAAAYYTLCDRARELGVPVDLDDPRAPKTMRGLRKQVRQAERRAS